MRRALRPFDAVRALGWRFTLVAGISSQAQRQDLGGGAPFRHFFFTTKDTAMTTTATTDLYAQAERRVKRKIGLMTHVTIFAMVNLGLVLLAQHRGAHWNLFPMLGWGIALSFHAMGTWLRLSRDGWHQRMVEAEAAKLRSQR
ncbi:MAG: hypothetical protein C4K60_09670 [Ideonella sp. MAG2]|nr:MAG: hypothetical protein C4K60_09670 [Ideonella sp. MAG2]